MVSGNAAAKQFETSALTPAGGRVRADAYGGLVGQWIDEIDARMAATHRRDVTIETPEDFIHGVSVMCGYFGLLVGLIAVVAFLAFAIR